METTNVYFSIEVRDDKGSLFVDDRGIKVTGFNFSETWTVAVTEESIKTVCLDYYFRFKAVSGNANINIDVRVKTSEQTLELIYSLYGKEQRFVKHD